MSVKLCPVLWPQYFMNEVRNDFVAMQGLVVDWVHETTCEEKETERKRQTIKIIGSLNRGKMIFAFDEVERDWPDDKLKKSGHLRYEQRIVVRNVSATQTEYESAQEILMSCFGVATHRWITQKSLFNISDPCAWLLAD